LNKAKIAIINYGAGNIASIENAFRTLKISNAVLTNDAQEVKKADAIVLPGVGAFAHCIDSLKKSGLIPVIEAQVFEKLTPLLGICVGMQLFATNSTENGLHRGLGWIKGNVTKIEPPSQFSVPHVGWNQISISIKNGLYSKIDEGSNFFFDHSYSLDCQSKFVSGKTFHGIDIVASVESKNIYGVQYHPEKSGRNGLRVLREFANRI
jgi:glutamine amidotransferase